MKSKKQRETISTAKLAQMTQHGFAEVDEKLGEVRSDIAAFRHEMVTKHELRETEQHLLDAIRGIEVKRPEFEGLQHDVRDLNRRVSAMEKKR